MKYKKLILLVILWLSFFYIRYSHALADVSEANENAPIGNIANVVGKVEIQRGNKTLKALKDAPVYETDKFTTYENGAVKINFKDGSNFMAFKNTTFKINEYKLTSNKKGGNNLRSIIQTFKGDARAFVKPKEDGINDVKIATANSVMLLRGSVASITGAGSKYAKIGMDEHIGVGVPNLKDASQGITVSQGMEMHRDVAKTFSIPTQASEVRKSFIQALEENKLLTKTITTSGIQQNNPPIAESTPSPTKAVRPKADSNTVMPGKEPVFVTTATEVASAASVEAGLLPPVASTALPNNIALTTEVNQIANPTPTGSLSKQVIDAYIENKVPKIPASFEIHVKPTP